MTGEDVKRELLEQRGGDEVLAEAWALKFLRERGYVVLTAGEAAMVAKCLGETEANSSGKDLRPVGDAFKLLTPEVTP